MEPDKTEQIILPSGKITHYLSTLSIYLLGTLEHSGCALASPPSRTSGGWSEAGGGAPAAPGQTRGQGDLGQSGDS